MSVTAVTVFILSQMYLEKFPYYSINLCFFPFIASVQFAIFEVQFKDPSENLH